jgi:predicted nuclease with TOPRIM domain
MSANHKAAAAWDDYVSQQQQEKIEELERELNAANESFRKLNIHTLNLVDRIRRLEEAGDKMFWTLDAEETGSVGKEMWRKAKEAKP